MPERIYVDPSDQELQQLEGLLKSIAERKVCIGWFTEMERGNFRRAAESIESALHFVRRSK